MPRRRLSSRALAWIALAAIALAACDSIYYKTMKKFGWEKRDILVKKVVEARGAQADAQKEIKTTLERFKEIVDVDGGSLEDKYNKLNDALQRSEERARKVDDRIKAVRDVSSDLFKEWQNELGKYSDRRMRQESERELRATKARTETLIQAMARAQQRVEPVLKPLRNGCSSSSTISTRGPWARCRRSSTVSPPRSMRSSPTSRNQWPKPMPSWLRWTRRRRPTRQNAESHAGTKPGLRNALHRCGVL